VQLRLAVPLGEHEHIGQRVAPGALGVIDPRAGEVRRGHLAAFALGVPVVDEDRRALRLHEAPGAAPVVPGAHDGGHGGQALPVLLAEHLPHRIAELELVDRAQPQVVIAVDRTVGNDFLRDPDVLAQLRARVRGLHRVEDGLKVRHRDVLGRVDPKAIHPHVQQAAQVVRDLLPHIGLARRQVRQPAHAAVLHAAAPVGEL